MSFFKDWKLIVMFREMLQASERRMQNQNLLEACEKGDPEAVQEAIEKGADVNQMLYIGDYYPPFAYRDEVYQAYVTPIIMTAVKASAAKNKKSYFQVLSLLAQRPDINLDRVVKDIEIEYKDSCITFRSLNQVLTSPERVTTRTHQYKRSSAHLYPISDEVVLFLTALEKKRETDRYFAQMRQSEGRT